MYHFDQDDTSSEKQKKKKNEKVLSVSEILDDIENLSYLSKSKDKHTRCLIYQLKKTELYVHQVSCPILYQFQTVSCVPSPYSSTSLGQTYTEQVQTDPSCRSLSLLLPWNYVYNFHPLSQVFTRPLFRIDSDRRQSILYFLTILPSSSLHSKLGLELSLLPKPVYHTMSHQTYPLLYSL